MTARRTIALAALCVAAVPATADAGTPTRKFRVEVEGVQVTKWKEHYTATQQCDQSANGSGTERVTFASRRPTTIVARRYGKNFVLFGNGKIGDDEVDVRAKVKRHGNIVSSPLPKECEGTGGSGPGNVPKDCGTRRTPWDVSLGWSPAGRGRGITLDSGVLVPLRLFRNCPVIGPSFPEIITSSTSGSDIRAAIPAGDLFNRKLRKHIVIGRGKRVSKSATSDYKTTIKWTVSLTAAKRKRHK